MVRVFWLYLLSFLMWPWPGIASDELGAEQDRDARAAEDDGHRQDLRGTDAQRRRIDADNRWRFYRPAAVPA